MNVMLNTTHEAPHTGSAVYIPEHEESIWFCPECLVNGVENKLLYTAATKTLGCPHCSAEYANDAKLAQAYVEQVLGCIGDLKTDLNRAESHRKDAEAKLREVRRVAA